MDEKELREEARTFFEESWDPDLSLREWWARLADSGWGLPTWPREWFGRGLTSDEASVVEEERRGVGAVGPPAGLSVMLAGPTIIAHGNEDVKQRFLRGIATGEDAWCQLFSEPGAGSDLASLQTKAIRDGDEWVVNGQKVWTSGAQVANLGMLLARTSVDAPKHKGITYFVIEMDQPGVEVRPLREMTGRAMFNEVFFTDARVDQKNVVGEENEGWATALTTLANERVGLGGGAVTGASGMPGRKSGQLDRRAGDAASLGRRGGGMAMAAMAGARGKMMQMLAKAHAKADDPVIRQEMMKLHSMTEIGRYTALRSKAAVAQGRRPGPEASTGKLSVSRQTRASRDVGLAILGAQGMLAGGDAPMGGAVQEIAVFSPAVSIYGGTDEIQHNIIGERVLGLPKEPASDKDVPFKDLKVGTQRKADAV